MFEKTLIIFKPDCIRVGRIGEILKRFEGAGFSVCGARMARLDEAILREHYAHITDLPVFPDVAAYMSSHPVLILVLQAENIVARVRELLGPTDSATAPKGTIRGDYGTDKTRNVAHASDSPENAAIEIARFFREDEIFNV
jgi:nucleoside-diphosphate kinase